LASATELVCDLGAGDRLVGRSHECDHPSWVGSLPSVTHPTFDVSGSSVQIDALVRERIAAGEPLYAVELDRLDELAPDLVITQTHCDVCAVTPADLARGARPLASHPLVALGASSIDGILDDFLVVARALGLLDTGLSLVERTRARLDALSTITRQLRPPTVVCLEWIDPVFPMSNWAPAVVALAGGDGLLGTPGQHSRATPWDAVKAADPEFLVVAPCGFDLKRTLSEMPALAAHPGFERMRAVRSGRVYAADGNLYFNRSGPSLFETPAILAEMLHPERFAPAHQGTAWVRWVG
jgi:iron complex transport system substrate-binding protein